MDHVHIIELCKLLDNRERLHLFDLLYNAVGKRKAEKIHLALNLKLQAVYRYFPESRKRVVPNYWTAAKIVKALKEKGKYDEVIGFLDLAAERMRKTHQAYILWRKAIPEAPPLSYKQLERIKQRRDEHFVFNKNIQNPDWRESLVKALTSAGFPTSSVPERSEGAILRVLNILNYARRSEPTREMKRRAIEKELEMLYDFFINEIK